MLTDRILALDLGEKRVGVAVSDPFGHFAIGLETLERKDSAKLRAVLQRLKDEYGVARFVLGLPINMNGTEGPKAQESREFGQWLEDAFSLPVELLDERLTSRMAEASLRELGKKPSRNKGQIDQLAAQRLLQDYLDRQAYRARNPGGDA